MDHYEVWVSVEDEVKICTYVLCNTDKDRDRALSMVTDPYFDWSCDAESVDEFFKLLYEHNGWEPYKPMRLALDLPESETDLEKKLEERGYFIYEVDGGNVPGGNIEIDALKRPVKIRIRRRKMKWSIDVALIQRKTWFSLKEWSATLYEGQFREYPRGFNGKIEHLLDILDEIEQVSNENLEGIISRLCAIRKDRIRKESSYTNARKRYRNE